MSQALYRRYRPETFADVIGQEHVTEPLQQALRSDRVNHAYLFSGPRGCGKTTSARILARCLNCAEGPTPEPCGVCDSCVALARGGPGHIDVIEIDAASHGGVDDARELRDKAFFSPAASRYKIYIVDEAHMVSTSGFNALLKIVEEPPPHLKFIFATTEPDKVIGTIRSRTHHYPFRLVPPSRLQDYLAALCEREQVVTGKGVLPLVVRAGAGSVRDSLSVLDQLMAGAGPEGITYPLATALLGYTDAALLDDVVEAFAAGDGAAVFGVVDRVIEGGHDPKRFAEDLLARLRDLIVLAAVPDAAGGILGDLPADQLERLRHQAGRFGAAELSRAADLLSAGLTEMRGATAPRLQLELMCARVLLPGAHDDERSIHARLDRMERRLTVGALPSAAGSPPPLQAVPTAPDAAPSPDAAAAPGSTGSAARAMPTGKARKAREAADPAAAAADGGAEGGLSSTPDAEVAAPPGEGSQAAAQRPADAQADAPPTGGVDLGAIRTMWDQVVAGVSDTLGKKALASTLRMNSKVLGLHGTQLTVGFSNVGARDYFVRVAGDVVLGQALIEVLGLDLGIEAVVDPSAAGGGGSASSGSGSAGSGSAGGSSAGGSSGGDRGIGGAGGSWTGGPPAQPRAAARPAATRRRSEGAPPPRSAAGQAGTTGTTPAEAQPTRDAGPPSEPPDEDRPWTTPAPVLPVAGRPAGDVHPAAAVRPEDDEPSPDDPDLDDSGLSGRDLLARELGATVISESEV